MIIWMLNHRVQDFMVRRDTVISSMKERKGRKERAGEKKR